MRAWPGLSAWPKFLAFLALALWLPPLAAAEPPGAAGPLKIRAATEPNWPPLEFKDGSGRIVGFSVDFFQAVCREADCEVEVIGTVWDDIFTGLKEGRWDMVVSSVTITPERRREMNFSIPYYIVRQSLLTPASSSITSPRQLDNGQRVGFMADTTAAEVAARTGAAAAPYPDIADAVAALAQGEVEAVICEDVVAQAYMTRPEYAGKMKIAAIVETPGAEELYAAALRLDDLDLLTRINDGIKAVMAKGLDREIHQKWFGPAVR
ncbi:MAG: transporter substrate-binding domain-containing protein [Candidatus Adiutrix sp.]|jgi:polar amino acid transport system substrate-binding protein|nr:transporter substrate-binding domain-containing protein [Candidatus Adiutrix sp.]